MRYLFALFTLSAFAMTNYQASKDSPAYTRLEACEEIEKAPCYAFEAGQDREILDPVLVNGKRETRENPAKKAEKAARVKAEEDAAEGKKDRCRLFLMLVERAPVMNDKSSDDEVREALRVALGAIQNCLP